MNDNERSFFLRIIASRCFILRKWGAGGLYAYLWSNLEKDGFLNSKTGLAGGLGKEGVNTRGL